MLLYINISIYGLLFTITISYFCIMYMSDPSYCIVSTISRSERVKPIKCGSSPDFPTASRDGKHKRTGHSSPPPLSGAALASITLLYSGNQQFLSVLH